MKAADDRPFLQPVTPDRGRELIEPGRQLQVDVEPDLGRLVDEERERVIEGREVRGHLAERLERLVPDPSGGSPVTDLVEMIGVGENERPVPEVEDIELDQVDARIDGGPKRVECVLRRQGRGAAVTDPEIRLPVTTKLDHATLRSGRRRRSPPVAMIATTTACRTTIPAASCAVSCQNASG